MNSSNPDIIKEQLEIEETDAKSRKRKFAMGEHQLKKSITEPKNDKVERTFDMPTIPLLDSPSNSECVSLPNSVKGDSHSVFYFRSKDFLNTIINTNCSPTIISPRIAINNNYEKKTKYILYFLFNTLFSCYDKIGNCNQKPT